MEKMIWSSDILEICEEYNNNVAYRTGVLSDIKGLGIVDESVVFIGCTKIITELYVLVTNKDLTIPIMTEEAFKDKLLSLTMDTFSSLNQVFGGLFKETIDRDILYSIYIVRISNMNPFKTLRNEVRDLTYAVKKLEEIVYRVNTQIPNPV